MNPDDTLLGLLPPIIIILTVFLYFIRKVPRVYITDFMQGVRYVRGSFRDVIGPGSYRPLTRNVHVEIVDMRPVPFVLDRIFYRDALQSDSVASIGAELLVDDPYLATTALKNRVSDSMPMVRDALRSVLSRGITDQSPEFRVKAAQDIATAACAELSRFGMKISDVEITELASRSGVNNATAGPN